MADWEDVYEHQMALWGFWRTPTGKQYAEGYRSSVTSSDGAAGNQWLEELAGLQETACFIAEPVSVDREMNKLAEAAAETFEPEPLMATDLITPCGFLWLPEPWYIDDRHGKRVSFRALLWAPMYHVPDDEDGATFTPLVVDREKWAPPPPDMLRGIVVSLYSKVGDVDDYWDREGRQAVGEHYVQAKHALSLAFVAPWRFGEPYEPPGPGSFHQLGRLVQTIFRLMQQTIAIRGHGRPSRPGRRRAQKARFPEKNVTVITLRRPNQGLPPGHEGKHVEWTHRWLVAGHWRNQWFATLGTHRQIWISAFVKGPADKPLEIRQLRAFQLSR